MVALARPVIGRYEYVVGAQIVPVFRGMAVPTYAAYPKTGNNFNSGFAIDRRKFADICSSSIDVLPCVLIIQ